jgi:hydrogenase maturation protease
VVSRIICVGSRLSDSDAAGPRVHDRLAASALPEGVELVDGGLAGLDLARFVAGARRVVFVDAVRGFSPASRPSAVVVLEAREVAAEAPARFDHAAGLPYLLRALEATAPERAVRIDVVGVEGEADETLVREAAATALRLALGGRAAAGGAS